MRDDLFRAVLIGDGEDILCGNRIDRAVRIVPSLVFDFRVGYFQHFSLDLRRIFFWMMSCAQTVCPRSIEAIMKIRRFIGNFLLS